MTAEDETYLLEEVRLSTNVIHQKEMQLALAEGYFLKERPAEAEALLKEITAERAGLWTEESACPSRKKPWDILTGRWSSWRTCGRKN